MRARLKCMLAMLLLTISRHAFGQDVGLKAGMGRSGFAGGSEFAWARTALNASAFAVVRVTPSLELQPELVLGQQRGRSSTGTSDLTIRATSVSVPVLARYALPETPIGIAYLLSGVSLSYRARCSMQFEAGSFSSEIGCDGTMTNRWAAGLEAGAGIELGMKATRVVVEARAASNRWSVSAGFVRPLRDVTPTSATPSAPLPRPAPDAPARPAPER